MKIPWTREWWLLDFLKRKAYNLNNMTVEFGSHVRDLRQGLPTSKPPISQRGLAQMLGVNHSTVIRVEFGSRNLSAESAVQWGIKLHVEPNQEALFCLLAAGHDSRIVVPEIQIDPIMMNATATVTKARELLESAEVDPDGYKKLSLTFSLGTLVKYYQKRMRIPQKKLGELVGLHQGEISRIEANYRNIGGEHVDDFISELGVPLENRAALRLLAEGHSPRKTASILSMVPEPKAIDLIPGMPLYLP